MPLMTLSRTLNTEWSIHITDLLANVLDSVTLPLYDLLFVTQPYLGQ